jgi:hypothetical protein
MIPTDAGGNTCYQHDLVLNDVPSYLVVEVVQPIAIIDRSAFDGLRGNDRLRP